MIDGLSSAQAVLTGPQRELYEWLRSYIGEHRHSPSIRQMVEAMGLRSPAPIQSRLRHLQRKGWITWQEGQARTLQLLAEEPDGVPVLGSVAAGGLIDSFDGVRDHLDLRPVLTRRGLFALTVNGGSMEDAHIADGDVVLMEPVLGPSRLRNGTIVAATVPGSGATLKVFHGEGERVRLEPANQDYETIILPAEEVLVQGSLVGVWRSVGV